jgi:hypothetical protein
MGCISSSPSSSTEDAASDVTVLSPLTRKITIVNDGITKKVTIKALDSKSTTVDEGDIPLIKKGEYYVILGTKIVVDISTCNIVGILDDLDQLVHECTELVKAACVQYDLAFRHKQ